MPHPNMSDLQRKYWVFHGITTEATCTKCATYKEQAAELFKDMCSQMVSVNIPKFKLQMPELVLFGKVLQATYSRPVNTL
jgi:hypothetical protein